MGTIRESIVQYEDLENILAEITEGMNEGFKEGLHEGVKKGFVDGIKEYYNIKFFSDKEIDIKSVKDILKDAVTSSSKNTAGNTIKKIVRGKYASAIEPSIDKNMGETCSKIIENIRSSKTRIEKRDAENLKNAFTLSTEKIEQNVEKLNKKIQDKLPEDIVFGSAFNEVLNCFKETFEENLKLCEKRIFREIDEKIVIN